MSTSTAIASGVHRRSHSAPTPVPERIFVQSDPLQTPPQPPVAWVPVQSRHHPPAAGSLTAALQPGLLRPLRSRRPMALQDDGGPSRSYGTLSPPLSPQPVPGASAVSAPPPGPPPGGGQPSQPVAAPRSLWIALMTLYGCYGAAWGSWGSRLPEFKDEAQASDLVFAGLLICNIGAFLVTHQLHAALERRYRQLPTSAQPRTLRPTLPWSSVAFPLALALVPRLKTLPQSAAAMAATGVLSELFNHDLTHVTEVLKRDGAEHADELTRAAFAGGELLGSTVGLLFTLRDVRVGTHMLQVGAVVAATGGMASLWGPRALPLLDHDARTGAPAITRAQALLDAVGILMAVGHTAVANWLGIYLRDTLGASEAWATAGYVLFAAGAFVGELYSSHLIGPPHLDPYVMVLGGLTLPAALWAGVGLNGTYSVLVGAGTAGAGLGVFRPVAAQTAGRLAQGRAAPSPVLGVLSGLQNAGFLFGNILIGCLAQQLDLRLGLMAVGAAGAAKVALSERLRARMAHLEEDVSAWEGRLLA